MSEEPKTSSSVDAEPPVIETSAPATPSSSSTPPLDTGSGFNYTFHGSRIVSETYTPEEAMRHYQEKIGDAEIDIKYMQSGLKPRIIYSLSVSALGLIFLILGLTNPFKFYELMAQIFLYFGLAVGIIGLLFTVLFWVITQSRINSRQADIEGYRVRLRINSHFGLGSPEKLGEEEGKEEKTSFSYFDSLVRINVDNLSAYYTMVKIHTDNSFRVSVACGAVGFLFIIIGLIIGLLGHTETQTIAFISAASGIIIEFITGVFFYLYNRTVRQLKEYHDSLLAVQNILLAFKIVGDTQDEKEKVKMVGQMLTFLVGQPPIPTLVKSE